MMMAPGFLAAFTAAIWPAVRAGPPGVGAGKRERKREPLSLELAFCVLRAVYCVLCTVYCVLCTVCCVLCTHVLCSARCGAVAGGSADARRRTSCR